MRTLLRRAAVVLAVATATAGLAMPASAAPEPAAPKAAAPESTAPKPAAPEATAPKPAAKAPANWACPRIVGVCALDADGRLRMISRDEAVIVPPVIKAANNTPDHWCFYSSRGFAGERREVSPGEVVHDFGFDVWSARNGYCDW
ncbi:hypothetical protein AB0I81_14285 [Nonomuraea sp. NPDC050404]|uniref:hypothetical protein n=1 Tax=Nonomuraea sp. NPDC050404 TaxID=3155783 RepID=UPI003411D692